MEVISYSLEGNSFPIVIKHDNKKLFVKLHAGLSGEYSLISEWFGNIIGKLIGLNTRQPQWILLTDALRYEEMYIEVKDLIDKSLGVNIAFEYIEHVKETNLTDLSGTVKENLIDVFLLDVLMLNIDRRTQNHNLLTIHNNEILVTDFDSSLIFTEVFNQVRLSTDNRILQCLKSNPFYQKVDDDKLEKFIYKINQICFKSIITEIPDELLNPLNKMFLLSNLEEKKKNEWNLREILQNIEDVSLESEEDRNERIRKNRERIEKW